MTKAMHFPGHAAYCTQTEISSIDSLRPSATTLQSITLQYLACWQGREGGSWQAWTWVDRSAAPPWKAPLNVLKERESAGGPSLSWLCGWKPKGARWAQSLFFCCLNVHLSMYQCDWLRHFSWTSVKVSRAGALILRLWYFSWIAERTVNVNCSFLGRTHNSTGSSLDIFPPTRTSGITASWKSCGWLSENLITNFGHLSRYRGSSSGQRSFFIRDN